MGLVFAFLLQSVAGQPALSTGYVPQRVYDTARNAFTDFESMLADLSRAEVVFVGEVHDDANGHRLEAAMLDGLHRRKVPVTLSLEMFERDTQMVLDQYLAGTIPEDQFLKESRPWPRYATDYRPMVEMAKRHGWKVIASNLPRRLASEVAKGGTSAVEKMSPADRAFAARDVQCPRDGYFDRFATSMSEHPPSAPDKASPEELRARIDRYFDSQCVKDETMAEAIVAASEKGPVLHVNGSFHSDFGHGTVERARRRLAGRRVVVVSILQVIDLDAIAVTTDDLKRADYLLYTGK